MGILDLLLVHFPELGPLPGILQELAGDRPERVAALDGVALGRIFPDRVGFGRERREEQSHEQNQGYNCLMHVRPQLETKRRSPVTELRREFSLNSASSCLY